MSRTSAIFSTATYCRLVQLLTHYCVFFQLIAPPPTSTLFPYTTLFRSLILSPRRILITGTSLTRRSTAANATNCRASRSEEHTSELQSRVDLVCRLLLEKKNTSLEHLKLTIDNMPAWNKRRNEWLLFVA